MYEQLKLSNQLCFPLYALSKEITRRYTPFLQALDLTYPQYLVMLVLWEHGEQSVGGLGEKLYLDSGTLTPCSNACKPKDWLNAHAALKMNAASLSASPTVAGPWSTKRWKFPEKWARA
nr:MarR family transcriptional regulator [Neisseria weixii]